MPEPHRLGVRVEKRDPDKARQEFEQSLRHQGAVEFDWQLNGGKHHVIALPEVVSAIPTDGEIAGKKELSRRPPVEKSSLNNKASIDLREGWLPEVEAVVQITASGFNFGDESFRLDLTDAPEELRRAVRQKWDNLLANEAALGTDIPPQLAREFADTRARYGRIIAAMEAAASRRGEPTPPPVRPAVEGPTKAAGAQPPAEPVTSEQREARSRQKFTEAFGSQLPEDIYQAVKASGAFIVEPTKGKFVVVQIAPVSGGPRGIELVAWQVNQVTGGDVPGARLGTRYRSQLGDMSPELRDALVKALTAKQAAGLSDGRLAQAAALREQGRAFGRAQADAREKIGGRVDVMLVGESGQIEWKHRPTGEWEVVTVHDVRGVSAGAVFPPDLRTAPPAVREAAKEYRFVDPESGQAVSMVPTNDAADEVGVASPAEANPSEAATVIPAADGTTEPNVVVEPAPEAPVAAAAVAEVKPDLFAEGQPGVTINLEDDKKIRVSWRNTGGERYVVKVIATNGKVPVRQGSDYELRNLPSNIKTAVRGQIEQEKQAALAAAEQAARKKAEAAANVASQTGHQGKGSRAA